MKRNLSKSKLIAFRQCPKRLWLEVHRSDLRDDSASEAVFRIGNEVGDVARAIYDPEAKGELVDINILGFEEAFSRSEKLLEEGLFVVCEAGFRADGALAFADVMIPEGYGETLKWHMIEVKASASVKDYQRDDVAVQMFVAGAAGVPLGSASIAHINTQFVYEGDGNYEGLFSEVNLTEEAKARQEEVEGWLKGAHAVAETDQEPEIAVGAQCGDPFPCPFLSYCNRDKPVADYPLSALPRLSTTKREALEAMGIHDLREVPDDWLTETQYKVKEQTQRGEAWFDAEGAASDLADLGFPTYFLDFETVMFPVPIWKDTRPYQQLPFQFSLHRVDENGEMQHKEFLDLSGEDPSEDIARGLVEQCGDSGPIFAYSAGFEKRVMWDLAARFPDWAKDLEAIINRVVDLHPIAKNRYYHPDQHGSWSLKAVLPAICPDLSYSDLEGVADGGAAAETFREAIAAETAPERKAAIEKELLKYCHLDTLALVRLWEFFRGNSE